MVAEGNSAQANTNEHHVVSMTFEIPVYGKYDQAADLPGTVLGQIQIMASKDARLVASQIWLRATNVLVTNE